MKKILLILATILLYATNFVFSSISPTSGTTCKIKAEIINIDLFHDPSSQLAKEQKISQASTGWTLIKILEVKDNDEFCKTTYPINQEIFVKIDKINTGNIIQGDISYTNDEWGYINFLKNIEIITNDNNTKEFSIISNIPTEKQELYKKSMNKIFYNFIGTINKLNNEEKKLKIEKGIDKANLLLKNKKLGDLEKFVFSYFRYLMQGYLDNINE